MKYNVEEIQKKIHIGQLEGIGERLEEDIAGILNRAGIYFRIFSRAKTPFSIATKLEKEGYGFGIKEKKLQDLIGLRVVAYYYDDINIIRTALEKTFRRVGEWSMTDNTEVEFKASKLNGVFRLPDEYQRIYNGDISRVPAELTFEVQLRTISFEGWHEIEHDMRYKSPYGDEFWRNNEDLSRTLNCVLANLELCDWSTISVFDQLSYYHYGEGNWEMMLKGKFRLRFAAQPLAPELIQFLDENPSVAYSLYRCSRDQVVFALLREGSHEHITYNLLLKVANETVADYDGKLKKRLARICNEVTREDKAVRGERLDLKPLDVTPAFQLNVILSHNSSVELHQEFMSAVQMIGNWARSRFHNIANDIPITPEDYELHVAGYNLKILGNVSLGIYRLELDYVDITRKGVVWRTNVSLEKSSRIRMKVTCDYCHPPDRLVRDSFAKPRFVDEIFRKIGYEDVLPMSLKPRKIQNMEDVRELSAFIANSDRNLPVVLAVEEDDEERQINISRLAETVGTYAHVYLVDKKAVPGLVEASDYTREELMGAVWVTFRDGGDKFFTREMIEDSRFDFNKYAFDQGNVYEKAFRHKLVRLIKEKNC
ncbi:MAG: hypothetical protein J1F02_04970 [Lachnospiraceae bacterium]|nr:hypothetical protein [Lachnospiraceae bacterium]